VYCHNAFAPNGAPSPLHGPRTGPLWRETLRLRSHWFTSQIPNLRSSPTHQGENIVAVQGAARARKAYTYNVHTMGCGLVPHGGRLRHCYYYPSSLQPSAPYRPPWLGSTGAPLASQCLQSMSSTPGTASHAKQGANLFVTLKYGRGGWIYGRQNWR
jgi:hypothetical protein